MRAIDYETAINSESWNVCLDEIVLENRGQVKAAYAHAAAAWIMWDAYGRGYIIYSKEPLPTDEPLDAPKESRDWERSEIYDLKFV